MVEVDWGCKAARQSIAKKSSNFIVLTNSYNWMPILVFLPDSIYWNIYIFCMEHKKNLRGWVNGPDRSVMFKVLAGFRHGLWDNLRESKIRKALTYDANSRSRSWYKETKPFRRALYFNRILSIKKPPYRWLIPWWCRRGDSNSHTLTGTRPWT